MAALGPERHGLPGRCTLNRLFPKIVVIPALVLLHPIYFLSGLIPRREDLWVFGSWGGYRFADNGAAFFEYCVSTLGESIDLVWISRNRTIVSQLKKKGLKAYWILSLGGIISCLRARYFFFDCFSKDINHWLSRGAKMINLGHGDTPFKKSERDIDNTRSRYYQLFHGSRLVRMALATVMPWHLVRSEFYICTSPFLASFTQSAFGADEEDVIVTGYPRNDTLLQRGVSRLEGALADLAESLAEAANRGKVLCYLPTYRDDGSAFIDFDWSAVEDVLRQHGAIFVYKLHPQDYGRHELYESDTVLRLPTETDLYYILRFADVLITDYSSIFVDYLLLDRPIIHYVPDIEKFVRNSRSFYSRYDEMWAGPKATTFQELVVAVEDVLNGRELGSHSAKRRQSLARRLHTYFDAGSSMRVLREVCDRTLVGSTEQTARKALEHGTEPGHSVGQD